MPELKNIKKDYPAEKYSTRIIRMLDGKIIDDSAPLSKEELADERNKEKAKADKECILWFV